MNIKTITCHDVYNLGASLQAYALAEYLKNEGHDVQIIDYKPDYLSRHYSFRWVPNPRFDKPLLRQAYLLAKLPGRLKAFYSLRKKRFDQFRQDYLPLTSRRYASAEELAADCPEADIYIAGSDQIWNPVFPNGKDPAFFLTFVPEGKKKISYAASFSVEALREEDQQRMRPWLQKLDAVSVRESSGVAIVKALGMAAEQVMDPVFLLDRAHWEQLAVLPDAKDYILVYDFDGSALVREAAQKLAAQHGKQIISVFPMEGAAQVWTDMGPREFLGAILNADIVLSNSFHATAFSLIFGKAFYVMNREEHINTRMRDLLKAVGLEERLLTTDVFPQHLPDWSTATSCLERLITGSKAYLQNHIFP